MIPHELITLRQKHRKILKRGNEAAARGDYPAAERAYIEYLKHVPDDPKLLFNMGVIRQSALKKEKDLVRLNALAVEAVAYYSDAISSRWQDTDTKAECLNNHGLIMGRMGFPDKAKIAFHFALQLNPGLRAARLNYADLLVHDGEYDAADREFFEIINSDPHSAGAQFSRSMILLLMGDLKRGFMEYRARFSVQSCISKIMQTDKPMWNGEPLDGKTLIATLEQGFGDHFMFVRYFAEIKKRWPTSKIFFSADKATHLLLNGTVGLDGCLPDHLEPEFEDACPEFNYHAPLLHLPDILGTTLETVPNETPYIFPQPDWIPLKIGVEWEPQCDPSKLSFVTDTKKIGICWAGSPTHGKDRFRSMKPEQFQRFIDAAPDAQFYSLQCGPKAYETEQLTNCVNLPKEIHDWTQTANAILQMDLIVTVDTAVAHLAGALGVSCWILLPTSPDWRWMLGRNDTPWYPKARLFRQKTQLDWEPVIQEVCEALK